MQANGINGERGAMLVHFGVALLAICAFTAFVIDQGVLFASRGQAQNAADAAALAGATSLAFDDPEDEGRARAAAAATGRLNAVWGQPADIDPDTDVTVGPCPAGTPGLPDSCVRADVYRNQQKHPLPTIFAQLASVAQQGVRAMAVAQVAYANATDCLKPWAIGDRWVEANPDPAGEWHSGVDGSPASTFDRYDVQGQTVTQLPGDVDSYEPPTEHSTGSGFTVANDYGLKLALKAGARSDSSFASGWFLALDVGRGARGYKEQITSCAGTVIEIGSEIELSTQPGNMRGPTRQAVLTDRDSLVNRDPDAYWDETLNGGRGGVAGSAYALSPRIVPVPLFNMDEYIASIPNGRSTVRIVNIIGFFVEGLDGDDNVVGRIVNYPGVLTSGTTPVGANSSFLKTVLLVR